MMRKKILFALGVVVLIITLFGLCGMLLAGMMLPGDNGKTSFGIYPAVPYPVVGLLLAFGLFALGAVKKGVHPLTVLPAFAASALWLCLSGTPVFSVTYKLTDPQILPSALMLLGLTGCAAKVQADDLMKDITPGKVSGRAADDAFKNGVADFAVHLFQNTWEGEKNSLISPLSVMLALSMTANGAKGETLTQMEALLASGRGS